MPIKIHHITVKEFFTDLFSLSHTGVFSSMNDLFKVMPKHLNWIHVVTLMRPLQNRHFFEPFRSRLASVLYNPCAQKLKGTNWWPDILYQDFVVESRIHGSIKSSQSSRTWPNKAGPDHHTNTIMLDCWYDCRFMKCCVSITPDVTGRKPFSQMSWGSSQCFLPNVRQAFMFFLGSSGP